MKATDANCVSLMILNILHGRVALYKMADWLAGTNAAAGLAILAEAEMETAVTLTDAAQKAVAAAKRAKGA